jgi:F-type H+-transporting ATPase subunit b
MRRGRRRASSARRWSTALDEIRKEVADLTVIATEKVTRKSLGDEDHRKLVEDALSEVDFSVIAGDGEGKRN